MYVCSCVRGLLLHSPTCVFKCLFSKLLDVLMLWLWSRAPVYEVNVICVNVGLRSVASAYAHSLLASWTYTAIFVNLEHFTASVTNETIVDWFFWPGWLLSSPMHVEITVIFSTLHYYWYIYAFWIYGWFQLLVSIFYCQYFLCVRVFESVVASSQKQGSFSLFVLCTSCFG